MYYSETSEGRTFTTTKVVSRQIRTDNQYLGPCLSNTNVVFCFLACGYPSSARFNELFSGHVRWSHGFGTDLLCASWEACLHWPGGDSEAGPLSMMGHNDLG